MVLNDSNSTSALLPDKNTDCCRLHWLDVASGIMIAYLLFIHALGVVYDQSIAKVPFLYFIMPWFFYKSGMMFKPKKINHLYLSKDLLNKDKIKLLKTFVVWSIVGYLIMIIWEGCVTDELTLREAFYRPLRRLFLSCAIPYNIPLWFIPILFVVRQIGNICINKESYFFPMLICVIIYGVCEYFDFRIMPKIIRTTPWGLLFFLLGCLFENYNHKLWTKLLCVIIYLASLFTIIPTVYQNEYPLYIELLWLPVCFASCAAYNMIVRKLDVILAKYWRFPLLSYLGRNAMYYYVSHFLGSVFCYRMMLYWKPEWANSWYGFAIIIATYIVVLPLLKHVIECVTVLCKRIK